MKNIFHIAREWLTRNVRRPKGLKLNSKLFVQSLAAILAVLLVVIVIVLSTPSPEWIYPLLGLSQKSDILRFLGFGIGGTLLALGAVISYRRAKALEDTANAQVRANKNQEQGLRQERMKNAIKHLANSSASVRLGGAYELFHLAKDTREDDQTEDLSQTALDILCAHIRQTTREKEYTAEYESGPAQDDKEKREDNPGPAQDDKEKREDNPGPAQDDEEKGVNNPQPSEEIQSLLNLLFMRKHEVFKDRNINLRGAFLRGAYLWEARLKGANLMEAQLQGADLGEAQLQGADLGEAQLQGADLWAAQLQGADLWAAQLQGARLMVAQLQGAHLWAAQLQGARLMVAQLQGADLMEAQLQGADLMEAQLQGADLWKAQLQGANLGEAYLREAYLQGANLGEAYLREAYLQGANLGEAYLQGANLGEAYLQGADLGEAYLQGADLGKAQLQGANLFGAQLQGTYLMLADLRGVGSRNKLEQMHRFIVENNIRQQIGKESDLSRITFSGGLTQEDVDSIVESMPNDEHKKRLLERLMPHVGKPPSYELPKDNGAITGSYTKEEAEKWIAEYNEAMSDKEDPIP